MGKPPKKDMMKIPVIEGPEWELFSKEHRQSFLKGRFRVGSDSNRMGYRLEQSLPRYSNTSELISSGIVPGTVQILNSGKPVVLMADAQTTGGYPRIAVLTREGISRMAQCKPGDSIRFRLI